MPPKTPDFWYPEKQEPSTPSLISLALMPLSWGYNWVRQNKNAKTQTRSVHIPVLCVGNIVAGGSGKTPTLLALHDLVKKESCIINPFFLTRGYGGELFGPEQLTPQKHGVKQTGDEAQMLMQRAPTILSVNRYKGACLAQTKNADLLMMDDGFQNPGLYKDINILVIDGKSGFGNGHLIPAGPLREPVDEALARTHAIVLIGDDQHAIKQTLPAGLPVFSAHIAGTFKGDKTRSYFAFAGLGHPFKFKKTLEKEGIKLSGFKSFPDHHPYTSNDLNALLQQAENQNARLLTTEKDIQRIPDAWREKIDYYPVRLIWENENQVMTFLEQSISDAKESCRLRKGRA